MEDKYYVVNGDIGLTLYDESNDQMLSMDASSNDSKWIRFSLKEAQRASKTTGWNIVPVD